MVRGSTLLILEVRGQRLGSQWTRTKMSGNKLWTKYRLNCYVGPLDTLDVITLKWLFNVTMVRRRHMHSLECCRYIFVLDNRDPGIHLQPPTVFWCDIQFVLFQILVTLGFIYNPQQYSGVIFQVMFDTKKKKRNTADLLAAGGRYDDLVNFCVLCPRPCAYILLLSCL